MLPRRPVAHRDFARVVAQGPHRSLMRLRLAGTLLGGALPGVPAGAGELGVVGLAEEADGQ